MTISTPIVPDSNATLAGVLGRARTQQLSLAELFQVAEGLSAAGQAAQAIEIYKTWIAFNDANPLLHLAYFNYAVSLSKVGDIAGTLNALRAALKISPDFGQAHINLGRTLEDCGLTGQAVLQWTAFVDATAEITPDRISNRALSLQHIGRVLEDAGKFGEAEAALWKAMELQPSRTEAAQHWISLRGRQCKWPVLAPSIHVSQRNLMDAMSSMTLACHVDDPFFHLAKAHRYYHANVGRPADLATVARNPVQHKSGTGQRLRVGYLSSDLREHAVGFALCQVMELHDKTSLEIFAYNIGETRPGDETQTRIRNAVDRWRDIASLSDVEAAKLIAGDKIDILVDLNGYTKHARTKILAYRPAPVIVNYCGYPGSMATPFHNYLIADGHIIPPGSDIYYSEKVLRLACYLPVDGKGEITRGITRAAVGLPEDAFVFACLNGMQKITVHCFARWMTILAATPGSVLWLRTGGEEVDQRLRQTAKQSGVEPERLIFAPGIAGHANHLARLGLADLFLDTFPYGAHATATDALTAGLPVLTFPGKSFASRVCASIVSAAGVPELVCGSPDDYVHRAVAFAHDRASLAAVREKLARDQETSVLRDTAALTRRLEELYHQMQGEAERGETPAPDLRNLNAYYEIGAELAAAGIEFESEQAYRQRYREQLTLLDEHAPLLPDARLWTGTAC